MKKLTRFTFFALLLVALLFLFPASSTLAATPPVLQTFFVPLPEDIMLQYFWDNYSGGTPVSPVRSVTSIAIGTNGTVVYYDQWEDGNYEADLSNPTNIYNALTNQSGTQIWGDGVVANGCPPSLNNNPNPCTLPIHDTLNRDSVITLDNLVAVSGVNGGPYSRNSAQIFFDGRDKIGTSLPVAVTRALWPTGVGSLVADAQAVQPTERWGIQYVSPVGENNNNQSGSTSASLSDVRLLIQAGPGGATISVDANADGDFADPFDRNNFSMTEGQVISVNDAANVINGANGVKAGALVNVSSGIVQVTLLVSGYNSTYENRFYNLVPRADWANDYYSPVGTPTGGTQCTSTFIYNPNASAITVSYDFAGGGSPDGTQSIGAGAALEMPSTPDNSGARFYTVGGQVFLPISFTDCPRGNNGDIYDWGNELYPVDQLSPELLIGWAAGCSDESYQGVCLDATNTSRFGTRSFIWLTPLANTTIYVDTNGSGISCPGGVGAEKTINATALNSYRVSDDPTSRTYVHDNFSTVAYNRPTDNQGFSGTTLGTWGSNWTESGDDGSAASGMIYIVNGGLRFRDNGGTNETNISIRRQVNLANQIFSRLSFKIRFIGTFQADDAIAVEISPDGGATWTTLEVINGPISYPGTSQLASRVYRTSAFNSANTNIRFRTIGNLEAAEYWEIDEVHLDYAPDGDFDMTGSYIRTCDDTLVAAAFGQYPPASFSGDDEAMDLGMGVPPYGSQIRLTKTANASYVAPGDPVTYTFQVRLYQTFSTSVNDVSVVDNYCSPVTYVSGDNGNNALDPGEVWSFTCTTRMFADTTNTAIAYAFYNSEPIRSLPAQATVKLNGSIGDTIWLDEDGDGDQDAGEPGLANVRVTLSGTAINGSPVSLETVTDSFGRYLFPNVPPSNASGYTISVDTNTLPAGLAANPTYDENGIGTAHTTVVVLESAGKHTTADFGYNWASPTQTNTNTDLGAIGDRLWMDADGDGFQDPDEAGLAGVTVTLYYDPDQDGVFDTPYTDGGYNPTRVTDATGGYIFDDLPAGAYAIAVTPPSGYAQTGDPDQPGVACTSCDGRTTAPVLLGPGDVFVNADFGFQPTGASNTIGNLVFLDSNGNGTWNPGEPGVPGVSVALLDGSGKVIATTLTDSSGAYSFPGLPDGTYTVWVNDTGNILGRLRQVSTPNNSSDGGQPCGTCNHKNTVTVSGGAGNLFQDFGYAPPGHASGDGLIGDTVFLDRNNNNQFDPGEGMEGVVVNLFNSSNQIIARTVTNANGQYFFGDLPAGTYTVDLNTNSLPNFGTGLSNVIDPDGGLPHKATLTLASGQVNLAQDFGYRPGTGNTISGTLWDDTNADGLLSGESGRFAGVTVTLYDANNNLVATTVTDSSGNYSFTRLPDGTYRVDVTDSGRVLNGYWHSTGPNPGSDNNSQADPYTVTVSGGQTNTTADFGYYRDPARIGDFAWADLDRDGLQDAGEPGLAGVQVQLTITWPGGGGTTTVTTFTDANGFYSFGNLLLDEDFDGAGGGEPTYSITFTNPDATYEPTDANVGGDDAIDSDGTTVSVTVTQGQYNDTIDSGYRKTTLSISKSAQAPDPLGPGDIFQFTIVVGNYSASRHTGIAISDALPAGTTYIPQSTVVNGFHLATYADNFDASSYAYSNSTGTTSWTSTPWVETNDGTTNPSTGKIQVTGQQVRFRGGGTADTFSLSRPANLANTGGAILSFTANRNGTLETADQMAIQVYNGTSWFTLETLSGMFTTGTKTYNISAYANANTQIRFQATGYSQGTGGNSEYFYLDNVEISYTTSQVKDNLPAGANPDLLSGVPPTLVQAGDGFALAVGQVMTVTFQVQVQDPVDLVAINNTASVVSAQQPQPQSASVVVPLTAAATIGDLVWLDADGDGVYDIGEPGLPNVQVRLYTAGGSLVATTYTDSAGRYLFTGVAPSLSGYYVDVGSGVPTGLAPSPGTSDPTATFPVLSNRDYLDKDFGYTNASTATAILGDLVYVDANGNGQRDPGEPGLGGVTLALKSAGPDGVLGTADDVTAATATTAADGTYYFTAITPGEYYVDVTSGVPAGYTLVTGAQGNPDPTAPITVAKGDVYLNADFGYAPPAAQNNSLGDRIWVDANNNGVDNPGEAGLPGVTVALVKDMNNNGLYDPGTDLVIATTTTDASGAYLFSGIPDGRYIAWVNDTNGAAARMTQTYDPDGACPGAACDRRDVNLDLDAAGTNPAGAAVTTADFGFNRKGAIGDRVWSDANNNGVQDPGEPGIGGVTVQLYASDGTTLLKTTTTKADGSYLFTNTPAGTYVVKVTAPGGYTQTYDYDGLGSPHQATLTLASGASNLAIDFGYRNPALADLSGSVWNDLNLTARDESEPQFQGVTIALVQDPNGDGRWQPNGPDGIPGTADDERIIATQVTDLNGDYTFADLPAGNYIVAVTDQNGVLLGHWLTSGLDQIPVTISGTTSVTGIDFGYVRTPATGSIGDYVWFDADRDGVQDAAETGIPNVTLYLYRDLDNDGVAEPGGDDGASIASTITNANGYYNFRALPAGRYFVDLAQGSLPPGLALTSGSSDPSKVIALSLGEDYNDADFGYSDDTPGTHSLLGDRLWFDANGDGQQDPGELGLPGIDVTITPPAGVDIGNGPGNPLVVTTDANGFWLVSGLPGNQNYVVTVDTADIVALGYNPTPTNGAASRTYIVPLGVDVLYADFGFNGVARSSVGDTVYLDADGDGTQDAGEPGLANVEVRLYDSTNTLVATTYTDAQGRYVFTGLAPASYSIDLVDATVPPGLVLSQGSDPTGLFSLSAGQFKDDVDFGYKNASATAGILGDRVWVDADGDTIQDPGEVGLAGVTVQLYLDDGDGIFEPGTGDTLVSTQNTLADGSYLFTGLPAGSYWVSAADPASYANTTPDADPGTPNTTEKLVTLSAGQVDLSADFGYQPPAAQNNTIGDRLWWDANGNGVQEPSETGLPGVTVVLLKDTNGNGVYDPGVDQVVASTTTTPGGTYQFTGVPDGKYIVWVNDTAGELNGTSQTYEADAGLCGACNRLTPVDADSAGAFPTGQSFLAQDFGFRLPGTLGDTVYLDLDGNASQGGSEPGLPGVTLDLYTDPNGDGDPADGELIASTVTDAAGRYTFTGLPDGTYVVQASDLFSRLTGLTQTQDPDGLADEAARRIVLSGGKVTSIGGTPCTACDLNLDFGYQPAGTSLAVGSIGSQVWHDLNNDRLFGTRILDGGVDFNNDGVVNASDDGTLYGLVPGVAIVDGGFDLNGNGLLDSGDSGELLGRRIVNGKIDLNGDGLVTAADDGIFPNEPGFQGVTIRLWLDVNGNGLLNHDGTDNLIQEVRTGPDGTFTFYGLPLGKYLVQVTDEDGVLSGYTLQIVPASTTDHESKANNYAVTLTSGTPDNTTADFGYYAATGYTIRGTTFNDLNNNAVFNDTGPAQEPVFSGVPVYLYRDLDGNGRIDPSDPLIGTTLSNASGDYTFPNLPNGTYLVATDAPSVLPTGMLQTTQTATPQPAVQNVTLANADVNDQDFGFYAPSNISDYVWVDENENGLQEPGELGLGGVTVYLYEDRDNDGFQEPGGDDGAPVAITLTNASGLYAFTGMKPGRYYVRFELPAGYGFTTPNAGLSDALDSDALTDTLDLNTLQGFGWTAPARLGTGETNVDFDAGLISYVDYGDLPASYNNTVFGQDGARHLVTTLPAQPGPLRFGALVDRDGNGQESNLADGDDKNDGNDDEDGVAPVYYNGPWNPGDTEQIEITVAGCPATCYVSAWMDFNLDGDFIAGEQMDPGEQVLTNQPVVNGLNTVSISIPMGTNLNNATLSVRFRLYAEAQLGRAAPRPTGFAPSGEVEDHQWKFGPTAITLLNFSASATTSAFSTVLPLLASVLSLISVSLVILAGRRVLTHRRRH